MTRALPGTPRGRLAIAVALVVAVPVIAGARLARQGERDLEACDAARAAGDTDLAITDARRAALAEVPFIGVDARGYAQLESIARDAQTRGDEDHALKAWSAMRGAALASDGLVSRDGPLSTASHALAHLYVERSRIAAMAEGAQASAVPLQDEEGLARTFASSAPSFATRARRALGFTAAALLLGGLVLFVWRGGKRRPRPGDVPPTITPSSDTGTSGTNVPS